MLLARVEVDANTSSVAARIDDWNAVSRTDLVIALLVSNWGSNRRFVPVDVPGIVRQNKIVRAVPFTFPEKGGRCESW